MIAEEVLPLKFVSPAYTAVMECEPTVSVEVVNVAFPVPSSVWLPSVVVPSLNVTLPVGVPLPGELAVTVAVNVTACPNTVVPEDDVTRVVLPSGFTTSLMAGEVLPVKLVSPA